MKKNIFNMLIVLCLLIGPALTGCSERKNNANSHGTTPMGEPTAEYPGSGAFSKKQSDSLKCCKKK